MSELSVMDAFGALYRQQFLILSAVYNVLLVALETIELILYKFMPLASACVIPVFSLVQARGESEPMPGELRRVGRCGSVTRYA